MSTAKFDNLIHSPNKLQICALLSVLEEVEFKVLCDDLALSKSALSKHIKHLVDAEYVEVDRRNKAGRQYMWVLLTKNGHKAYISHIQALQNIIS